MFQTHHVRGKRFAAAMIIAAGLLVAACGGDDDDSDSSSAGDAAATTAAAAGDTSAPASGGDERRRPLSAVHDSADRDRPNRGALEAARPQEGHLHRVRRSLLCRSGRLPQGCNHGARVGIHLDQRSADRLRLRRATGDRHAAGLHRRHGYRRRRLPAAVRRHEGGRHPLLHVLRDRRAGRRGEQPLRQLLRRVGVGGLLQGVGRLDHQRQRRRRERARRQPARLPDPAGAGRRGCRGLRHVQRVYCVSHWI